MKLNHILAVFIAIFLFFGCAPLKTDKSLLSSANNTTNPVQDTTVPEEGELDIQPDNNSMSMNIDVSDRIEITGNCKDLDRRKNRILVEVFAGEDETVLPYISNAISNKCQSTAAGLPTSDTCFWVTKGLGVIEDAGLPTERSFPQCHNGKFGFAIKLGKILEGSSAGNYLKYTVRFKLRTLDGILADSVFSRVTIDRNLTMPNIDSVVPDQTNFACDLKMTAARFNHNILYRLDRTFTDAALTNFPDAGPLFNNKTTAVLVNGDSVFSWKDSNSAAVHVSYGMIAGVTYNYTLTATENNFPGQYPLYGAPTKVAATASCTMADPKIVPTTAPTANTCYLSISPDRTFPITSGQWAYSTVPGWTGPNSNGTAFTAATCNPMFLPSACTQAGLVAGTTYYFAFRETLGLQTGRWSNLISCKP